jgi:hypothetical protein
MAVLRHGRYVRKASEAEAKLMQEAQAHAALRRLTRRATRAEHEPGETRAYRTFLWACAVDIKQSVFGEEAA